MKKNYKSYYVTVIFLILSVVGVLNANVNSSFIINELYRRFIRNGFFTLALIIPITAGMGINFAITLGAIAAQIAMVLMIDLGLDGIIGFILCFVMSTILSIGVGILVGKLLNLAKGKEMIVSIIIGFLGNTIYQLVFMVMFGSVIKPKNPKILLDRGIGVKSMLDAKAYKYVFKGLLEIELGGEKVSLLPVCIILFFGYLVNLYSKSKSGIHTKAVGESNELAKVSGINVEKVRIRAIVISTILASYAQLFSIQNMGVLNVYTGHLSLDTFAAASLLAGGATFKRASVKNAFIGLILFHSLFILSPLAGQNIFKNPALGEYFRSFLAYGTIVFALILNLKSEEGLVR